MHATHPTRRFGAPWRLMPAAFAALALLAAASAARAQALPYPSKPIRVVSAFPTGFSPDLAMRILAEKLARRLGQQVVVDPRPGGNGFIAVAALKQAPADGYTLLLVSNAHLALNPHLFKTLPYDAERDFEPVSTIYRAPFFVATSATGPYQNVGQVIDAAKKAPERVTYAIPYTGSPPHFGGAALAHLSGTRMTAVPYKDGGQLTIGVATGEVDITLLSMGSLNPLLKAGRLKVLAVAAPTRSRIDPNVPTVEESGGPKGVTVESWVGLVAPRGTPPEIVRRLADEIARAVAEPDLAAQYLADGVTATAMTPAEMARTIRADSKATAGLVALFGMQAE